MGFRLLRPSSYPRIAFVLSAAAITAGATLDGCADSDVADVRAAEGEEGWLPPGVFEENLVPTEGHPGWTGGEGWVEHDGSASFRVPLEVPAGRNGIQPDLGLSYNSRRGDGLLGTGWTIDGLSMITRCARSELIDGEAGDVEFTQTDALCLDGERMVDGGDPAFFWGGGTHRLWRNGYDRILMEGSLDDANATFFVFRRDGTVLTYGGTGAAIRNRRVEADPVTGALSAPGGEVSYGWLLKRVEDRFGNYLAIDYIHELYADFTIETRPTEIVYGGHPSLGVPQRRVAFKYTSRDPDSGSVATWTNRFGTSVRRRLSAVEMYAPRATLVRRYELDYDTSAWTRAQRLTTVRECDAEGVCREPLMFDYSGTDLAARAAADALGLDPADEILRPAASSMHRIGLGGVMAGCVARVGPALPPHEPDYFPPGTSVMTPSPHCAIASSPQGWSGLVELSPWTHGETWEADTAGSFFFAETGLTVPEHSWDPEPGDSEWNRYIVPFDYDRDGELDILRWHYDSGTGAMKLQVVELQPYWVSPSPPGWSPVVVREYHQCSGSSNVAVLLADIDGNGVEDIIRGCSDDPEPWQVQLHDGTTYGSYAAPIPFPLGVPVGEAEAYPVEWDGDPGREVLVRNIALDRFVLHQLDGGTHTSMVTAIEATFPHACSLVGDADCRSTVWFPDLNGDGLTDLVQIRWENLLPFEPLRRRLNIGGALGPEDDALAIDDPDRWLWDELRNSSSPFHTYPSGRTVQVTDVNQDGLDDIIVSFGWPEADPSHVLYDSDTQSIMELCSPTNPNRCVRRTSSEGAIPSLALAHISDGNRFHTQRLGSAGYPDVVGSINVFDVADFQSSPIDLGADTLPDLINVDFSRSCGDGPLRPDCAGGTDSYHYYLRASRFRTVPDELVTVDAGPTPGDRRLVSFKYRQEIDADQAACHYPDRCVSEGLRVVAEMQDSLGRRYKHWYADPVAVLDGSGFLGFGHHYFEELDSGRVTEVRFDHRRDAGELGRPYANVPSDVISYVEVAPSRISVVHSHSEYKARPLSTLHHVVQLDTRVDHVYEVATLDGGCAPVAPHPGCEDDCRVCEPPIVVPAVAPLIESSVDWDYDEHGTAIRYSETTGDETQTVIVEPEHRPSEWPVGLPRKVWVTSTAYVDGTPEGHARYFEHVFDSRGFMERRITEPTDPLQRMETEFVANAFGLVETVTDSATGLAPRTTTIGYDSEYIYPRFVTNAAGHTTTYAVHPGLGVTVYARDANGVEQRAVFDGFGRERKSWTVGLEDATLVTDYVRLPDDDLRVAQAADGHGASRSDLDHLGFTHRTSTLLPDGWSHTDLTYTAHGQLWQRTGPYFEGATQRLQESYTYDPLGRVLSIGFSDGGPAVAYEYDGLETTVTDRRGYQTTVVADELGRVVSRTLEAQQIVPDFGPFGQLRTVTSAPGSASEVTWEYRYDAYGRLKESVDPDAGDRFLDYSAYGELVRILDGSGETLLEVIQRDVLGRVEQQWTIDDDDTTFTWDTAANGLGALHAATTAHGIERVFEYDSLGRPFRRELRLDTGASLSTETRYDSYGRVEVVVYPSGLRARYAYEHPQLGRPTTVSALLAIGGRRTWQELWRADEYDALGRVTAAQFGNGIGEERIYDPQTGRLENIIAEPAINQTIEYDHNGNVDLRRDDVLGGREESFTYDAANRLDSWLPDFRAPADYEYDVHGNLVLNDGVVQNYGEAGAGPHQITSDGLGQSYSYDSRGRRTVGGGLIVEQYSSADLPRQGGSELGGGFELSYDAFDQRVRKVSDALPGPVTYAGELYEQLEADELSSRTHRIVIEGQPVAEVIEAADGSQQVHYVHLNHQGSVAAVTDTRGSVEQYVFHEPFGDRDAFSPPGDPVGPFSTRGYTGHEHDDDLGLINMRGRAYDPRTGRFMSTDPIVRSPTNAESWNPYSYVENNPVTWTDPTGFCPNGCPDELTYTDPISWAAALIALAAQAASSSSGGSSSGGDGSCVVCGTTSSRSRSGRGSRSPRVPAAAAVSQVRGGNSSGVTTLSSSSRTRSPVPSIGAASGWLRPASARLRRHSLDAAYRRGDRLVHSGSAWDFVAGTGNSLYRMGQTLSPVAAMMFTDDRDLVALLEDGGVNTGVDRYTIEYGEFTRGFNLQDALFAAPGGGLSRVLPVPRGAPRARAARLPQDVAVNPAAPRPLPTTRSIGRASHNRALQNDIANLPRGGHGYPCESATSQRTRGARRNQPARSPVHVERQTLLHRVRGSGEPTRSCP